MDGDIENLSEGDVFYTRYNGFYHVFKLLKKDAVAETFHVLTYKPLGHAPSVADVAALEIENYHAPLYPEALTETIFLCNSVVTADELIAYDEYQRSQDTAFEQAIHDATGWYKKGFQLTDEGKLQEAIAAYTRAIELVPSFFEAIDNRAFCKMDLQQWMAAIADFELSLKVEPDSLLAEFSIGECYYRMGHYAAAQQQFAKCLRLDPSHTISREFLEKCGELLRQSG